MSVARRKKVPQGKSFNTNKYRLVYMPKGEAERMFLELHDDHIEASIALGYPKPSIIETVVRIINLAHQEMVGSKSAQ